MDKGFRILEELIRAASFRHKVLASNIANTDTPGYKAKDVDFKGIVGEEMLKLKTTDPRHIKSGSGSASAELKAEPREPWADGNNVELDIEVAKMTENALLYETGIKLLSSKIKMFKEAVRAR